MSEVDAGLRRNVLELRNRPAAALGRFRTGRRRRRRGVSRPHLRSRNVQSIEVDNEALQQADLKASREQADGFLPYGVCFVASAARSRDLALRAL